jgi:hypothetical protein
LDNPKIPKIQTQGFQNYSRKLTLTVSFSLNFKFKIFQKFKINQPKEINYHLLGDFYLANFKIWTDFKFKIQ